MKYIFICFLLLIGTESFEQTKKSQQQNKLSSASNALLDSFDNSIRYDINKKDIAGASYLIYQNGSIIRMKAFGEADVNTHKPLNTSDIFRLASMTKPITSLAMLLLQEDGLINMNDRLEKYLPAFANQVVLDKIDTIRGSVIIRTHPAKSPILLRHLLTHTSGFASQYGGRLGNLYNAVFNDIYSHDLTYFTNQLAGLPLNHEPGEGWVYGPSINVAAKVIEQVSGMPFQDFVQKRIFDPLQMNDSKFFLDAGSANRLTTLYSPDGNGNIKVEDPGNEKSKLIAGPKVFFSGSGGLNSTLEDYLKFCVMVLNNGVYEGKVIAKPETIALMKTDQVPLNINADINTQPGQLTEGFTFGYQIVRKENSRTPKTKGTISWGGATGPIFFIDQQRNIIAIYMVQMQPYTHINSRKNFLLPQF